jgi:FkbM family methyltransferase
MSLRTSTPRPGDGIEEAGGAAEARDPSPSGTPGSTVIGGLRTTAVIVHWGPVEPTVELAHRLEDMSAITAVVVVANDGTRRPADVPPATDWLVPGANLGFAGGFRVGADARPDTDVYLLLNNDVWLPERTVVACLDLVSRAGVGIVGPTLLNADGIHPGADRLTPLFAVPRRRRRGRAVPADVAFVNGAILFVRAECHRQVPMDTRFFLVYEETDLARRAAAAGWRIMVSPYQAWHTGGGAIPSSTYVYYSVRNRLWFARIHGGPWRAGAAALWLALATLPRATGGDLVRGRGVARCRFAWHGLFDGLGPLPPVDSPLPDEPRPARWERATPRRDRLVRLPRPRAGTDAPSLARAAHLAVSEAARNGRGQAVSNLVTSHEGPVRWKAADVLAARLPNIRGRDRLIGWVDGRVTYGGPVTGTLHNGLEFDLPDASDGEIRSLLSLRYKPPVLAPVLRAILTEGDCFYDVGANLGIYTLWAAPLVGPTGSVHAFEPVASTRERLDRLVRRNALGSVIVVPAAVGAEDGVAHLSTVVGASGLAHVSANPEGCTEARMVTLDSYARGTPSPRLIKIDVEGHELAVLRGAEEVLTEHRPAIVLEMIDTHQQRAGASAMEIVALLQRLGYEIFNLTPRGLRPAPTGVHTVNVLALSSREPVHRLAVQRLRKTRFARNQTT